MLPADQVQSVIYTVIFLALSVFVVAKGVSSGIEKVSTIAMPALFVMLLIVIIRACTLPGAGAGLEYVFKPNFEVFTGKGWISVLASAGGQLFFSLSLAMGIMITYGSYMPKNEDLQQSAIVIPFADTIVAVMAAMATMPAVFAAGLDPGQGPGMLSRLWEQQVRSLDSCSMCLYLSRRSHRVFLSLRQQALPLWITILRRDTARSASAPCS